ncbi:hypothetical protein EYZ11_013479 [Aspergillus tanneri]|uniref:Uncharacterized protein n=1 Tax=Aspergillus tanneri TaxID=1220188 RepID=A0A4S3IXT9_9EURO|nr:hypothetical protein EYZ11_013479 [Aspergillus tanneri]
MQTIQSEHYSRTRHDDTAPIRTPVASRTQDADAVIHLKTKIDALEARNQMLAKTLSQALNDIRSRMMKAEGLDTATTDTLKQALTKVQSVQTCLENSSTPTRELSYGHRATRQSNQIAYWEGIEEPEPISDFLVNAIAIPSTPIIGRL